MSECLSPDYIALQVSDDRNNNRSRKSNLICRLVLLCVLFLVFPIRRLSACLARGVLQIYGVTITPPSIFTAESMDISEGKNVNVLEPNQMEYPLLTSSNDSRPQLLLILGGNPVREIAGVNHFLSHQHFFSDDAFILLSSGALSRADLLNQTSVNPSRLQTDTTAVDTLTNFTTFAQRFSIKGSIAVATSSGHFRRAMKVASIVLGATGINFVGIELPPSDEPEESQWRVIRDSIRAIIWVVTDLDFRRFVKWYKLRSSFSGGL